MDLPLEAMHVECGLQNQSWYSELTHQTHRRTTESPPETGELVYKRHVNQIHREPLKKNLASCLLKEIKTIFVDLTNLDF